MLIPLAYLTAAIWAQEPVDFDRDVRPILADNCFACHGPDAGSRAADLRLDTREGATADLGGYTAVLPGDPEESELWARVTSEFEFEVMPPPDSHKKPLDAADLDVIKRWIEAGSPWSKHWAFVPPKKVQGLDPQANPIDQLLMRALAQEGLELRAPAETHTLARRMAFDLTGLPPKPAALARLGAAPTEGAWLAYAEELLASPHYGERMAMWWLDGARYADSDGFQQDELRTNWPWRDWVASAFQRGMPFDQFATWQLAGDLLPDATDEQILATCFQRNHMHNGEGGRNAEESRVDYVRDRTNTLGTVFLGLTLECAQCHDHKFDPISQRDYYSLSAFFDSIDESGRAGRGAGPFLKVTPPQAAPHVALAEQELAEAKARLARVRETERPAFRAWLARCTQNLTEYAASGSPYDAWSAFEPSRLESAEGSRLEHRGDGLIANVSGPLPQEDYLLYADELPLERATGLRLEILRTEGEGRPMSFAADGEFLVTGVKLRAISEDGRRLRDIEIEAAAADVVGRGADDQHGAADGVLGDDPRRAWTTQGQEVHEQATLVLSLKEPFTLADDEDVLVEIYQRSTVPGTQVRLFRVSFTGERGDTVKRVGPSPQESLGKHLASGDAELPPELEARLLASFLDDAPRWTAAAAAKARFAEQLKGAEYAAGEISVTVLRERVEPRVTSILERGVWDQKGDPVTRAFPSAVLPWTTPSSEVAGAQPTRLDLARWVTSPDQPLTARVIVNQLWQQLFGRGLVATPSDFGLQGSRPRYPEILDWLAVDFVEHGWDVRHVLRTIVASRAYRQGSHVEGHLLARDPHNELLARGPRFRLPSWMIRDAALAESGLLNPQVGGPPMYPHQPAGVWEDVFNGRFQYKPTLGTARLRRTLYAFWRRNAAPTYLFDAADRRTCSVDVRRTNTPLQALTLLNDRTFVEAAEALAARTRADHPGDLEARVQAMAQAVLQRPFNAAELEVCRRLHAQAAEELAAAPGGTTALDADAVLASTLLNLDEAITHE